NSLRAEDTAV
nr:immunoglobulin heavy chain junction region [Homo sapiens]